MTIDFQDACKRHIADATFLYEDERWANADHLFGFAAECGMKCLMQAFGMPVDSTGDIEKREDRKHVSVLLTQYEDYRSGSLFGPQYPVARHANFSNWDVGQRYEPAANFAKSHVAPHKEAAEEIEHLVNKALLQGILL
jgi:hypothetical protein